MNAMGEADESMKHASKTTVLRTR